MSVGAQIKSSCPHAYKSRIKTDNFGHIWREIGRFAKIRDFFSLVSYISHLVYAVTFSLGHLYTKTNGDIG